MLHSLNPNSDITNTDMSVLERRRLRFPQEPVILYDQQSDNLFSGFNSDQGLGELLLVGPAKPGPDSKTGSDDGFRSILTCGPGFETGGHAIPRTVSCPARSSAAGSKKRKKPDKTQSLKVTEPENSGEKKTRGCSEAESKTTAQNSTTTTVANESPKPDYIHVRARRGQATDSHSLAERVRREKISERMKFLQDLVPGCNKITGKAGMLDEIINYVQSLQRQVEFLSMKIAVINPRLDFEVGGSNYIVKEMYADAFNHHPIQFSQQQLSWEDEVQIHNLYGMEYQMLQGQSFTDLLEAGHVKMEM